MLFKNLLVSAAFTSFAHMALAEQFSSGPESVPLLELFTSEGCSSCPPADRWLSAFSTDRDLWDQYVPIAFHVDYWNYLGWEDKYAREVFSERQRRYRYQGYTQGVYTPGVILGGTEWRSWRRGGTPGPLSPDRVGTLNVRLEARGFKAEFNPGPDSDVKDGMLTIALLGMGIQTMVKAGENRGKSLSHDFVVLAHDQFDPTRNSEQDRGVLYWDGELPTSTNQSDARRLALAAWVSDGADLLPIQAVGGWLD